MAKTLNFKKMQLEPIPIIKTIIYENIFINYSVNQYL